MDDAQQDSSILKVNIKIIKFCYFVSIRHFQTPKSEAFSKQFLNPAKAAFKRASGFVCRGGSRVINRTEVQLCSSPCSRLCRSLKDLGISLKMNGETPKM